MEKFLKDELVDAYLEISFAVMSLRIPAIQDILEKMATPFQIKSSYSFRNQYLTIYPKNIISEVRSQGLKAPKNLRESFTQINSIFLISSWELLKMTQTYKRISKEKDIQFFRHIRNGCAHSNLFNFSTLPHPAKWRDKQINLSLKGQSVIPKFIKDGDPILLLIDINNKYFDPVDVPGYTPYVP